MTPSTISGINGGELLKVGAALVGFALLAALLGPAIKFIALGSLAIALLIVCVICSKYYCNN